MYWDKGSGEEGLAHLRCVCLVLGPRVGCQLLGLLVGLLLLLGLVGRLLGLLVGWLLVGRLDRLPGSGLDVGLLPGLLLEGGLLLPRPRGRSTPLLLNRAEVLEPLLGRLLLGSGLDVCLLSLGLLLPHSDHLPWGGQVLGPGGGQGVGGGHRLALRCLTPLPQLVGREVPLRVVHILARLNICGEGAGGGGSCAFWFISGYWLKGK